MNDLELPRGETEWVEVEIDPARLAQARRVVEEEGLAPERDEALLRYLVYLGIGYVDAESILAGTDSSECAFDALHRMLGAVQGRASVLQFHYGERARNLAEERLAGPAHDRVAGGYVGLAARLEAEIAVREERIRNLEEAVRRAG